MHDIFFFTDIHGMYDLYRAIMNYCNEQDPDAMIIFGGDAIDRGPNGYQIMKELFDNPKVVYLMGNHEEMFCKAARQIKQLFNFEKGDRNNVRRVLNACRNFDHKYIDIQNTLANGGMNTLLDWIDDGKPMDLIERVEQLPRTSSYENCDFCHAAGIYDIFCEGAAAEYYDRKMDEYIASSLIWSRSAMNAGWKTGRIAIFGHTPVQLLYEVMSAPKGINTPYKWVGDFYKDMTGAKLDMDTGAVFTGRAYVLNILTMQAQGFVDTDFKNDEIRKPDVEKIEVIQF